MPVFCECQCGYRLLAVGSDRFTHMSTMLRDKLAELNGTCPQCNGNLSAKDFTLEIEPLFPQSAVHDLDKLESSRTASTLNSSIPLTVAVQAEKPRNKLQSNGQPIMTNPQISNIRLRRGVK